ncbi:hypothetical protein ASC59_02845 [Leifsonia sp. Root1293]|nr:hypothetical protein ASC59_02845 [Leifsonia sp. Root1293]KRA11068.1 hypothetical protein ASD61_02845 [Leifsonia sp. Root60]
MRVHSASAPRWPIAASSSSAPSRAMSSMVRAGEVTRAEPTTAISPTSMTTSRSAKRVVVWRWR